MEFKRLFNEYSAQNDLGHQVTNEIEAALTPLVNKFLDSGCDPRDVQAILMSSADLLVCEGILTRRAKEWRKKYKEKV